LRRRRAVLLLLLQSHRGRNSPDAGRHRHRLMLRMLFESIVVTESLVAVLSTAVGMMGRRRRG
jgi:hypothetical protein